MSDTASLGAISIDVDSSACYRHIHGLPHHDDGPDPIYEVALPRFLEAMDHLGIKATLFVIGRDLENPRHQTLIEQASAAGHEIANHSYSHDYALSRWTPAQIKEDIRQAHVLIQNTTGTPAVGFRAPGYNQSESLFDAIEDLGYLYDSSFFPTPAYFAARATAITLYQMRQRTSQSLIGDMREFMVPPEPFFPRRKCRFQPAKNAQEARRVLEIPMSVAGLMRLPWLGTSITLAPDAIGKMMTRAVLKQNRPAIFELHAIDFAEAADGFEVALAEAQNDLKIPLKDKLRRLEHTFSSMAQQRNVIPMKQMVLTLKSEIKNHAQWMPQIQPV
jgi:peptidoglycan-N-acetylglucosamine deacetylase